MNILKAPLTDKDFVQSLIPQKYPFVMVDKLFYFSDNKVVSGFNISADNLFSFQSFFTASGLIENMAQTVALFTGYQYYLKKETPPTGYIGAIKKTEIIELPRVGEELVTTVNIIHEIMGVTLVNSQIECNGKVIASSQMKTVLA